MANRATGRAGRRPRWAEPMQWLTEFQQSFREPFLAFLAFSWPAFGVAAVAAIWYFTLEDPEDKTRSSSVDEVFGGDGDGGD